MGELTKFLATGEGGPPQAEPPAQDADVTQEVLEEAAGEAQAEETQEEQTEETQGTPESKEADTSAEAPAEDKPQEAPAPEKKAKEEKPPVQDQHEITVDGNTIVVDTEELRRGYQLKSASYKRLEDANKLATQARGVIQRFVDDPLGAAEELLAGKLGTAELAEAHITKLMEERLSKKLEEQSLPPEQQKVLWEKKKLEREKREWLAERQRRDGELQEKVRQEAQRQLETAVTAAMKEAGLPNDKVVYQAVAKTMLDYYNAGINLTANEAASMVQRERQSMLDKLSGALSVDEVITKYPDLARKIREKDLATVKSQTTKPQKAQEATSPPARRKSGQQRVATVQDFRQLIQKRL